MPVSRDSIEMLIRKEPLTDQEWTQLARDTVSNIHSNFSYLAQKPLRSLLVPYGRHNTLLGEFENIKVVCRPGFEDTHNLDFRGIFGIISMEMRDQEGARIAKYWGLTRHSSWVKLELHYSDGNRRNLATLKVYATSLESLCLHEGVADKICREIYQTVKEWEEGASRRARAARFLLDTLEFQEEILSHVRLLRE